MPHIQKKAPIPKKGGPRERIKGQNSGFEGTSNAGETEKGDVARILSPAQGKNQGRMSTYQRDLDSQLRGALVPLCARDK